VAEEIFLNVCETSLDMVDVEEKLEQGYLRCNIIIEVVGKPKEHVEETMRMLLKKLKEEKDVEVLEGKVHKPKEQRAFFSSFVELDILVKNMASFTTLCFDYMPSSVEITVPEHIRMNSNHIADFINDMLAKLHDVDMRFKNVNVSNQILEKNLRSLLRNFVMLLLEKESKSLEELSRKIGIMPKELAPFLKLFEEEGVIKKEGAAYKRVQ
jgi:hypothetical protein